jgi:hypothetical protein
MSTFLGGNSQYPAGNPQFGAYQLKTNSLHWQRLDAIFQLRFPGGACTVDTTKNLSVRFHAMADDAAIAVRTNGCQRVNRTLEAVESVTLSSHNDFKRLIVFVLADFACRHTKLLRARDGFRRCFFWGERIESPYGSAIITLKLRDEDEK